MNRAVYDNNVASLLEIRNMRSRSTSPGRKEILDLLPREPSEIQAWLVGSGIASLSSAVLLIHDAKVPGSNIHILDLHSAPGGGLNPYGDATNGYFLPFESHPHFHGGSIERLLSIVPDQQRPEISMLDAVRKFEEVERPPPQDVALTRALKQGESGPEVVYTKGIHIGIRNRIALIKLILESEKTLSSKTIKDTLDESFFETNFWMLWSTTFKLQPFHSAVEFQRHLCKYLEEIQSLNNVKTANRTQYNLHESIILPITDYLQKQGVDFRFNATVTDLGFSPEREPTTVTDIEVLEDDVVHRVELSPNDIIIATLGSTSAGRVLGTNNSSPPQLSMDWEDQIDRDWRLWHKLAQMSPKFGDPTNYLSETLRSTVETFTTTFQGPEFMKLYEKLAHDRPGTAALVTLTDSNWSITLNVPSQPVFSTQSMDTNIICGYASSPMNKGNYVKKPMYSCCGEEILTEVLSHLNFPIQSILATSKTVPCGMPLGTAPLLSRSDTSRPKVIPPCTTNIACVGQFVEIADETTMSMEYSVRSAEIAVSELMELPEKPQKLKKSLLLEVLDLML